MTGDILHSTLETGGILSIRRRSGISGLSYVESQGHRSCKLCINTRIKTACGEFVSEYTKTGDKLSSKSWDTTY